MGPEKGTPYILVPLLYPIQTRGPYFRSPLKEVRDHI